MLNLVLKTRQIKNDYAAFMPTSNTRKAPKLAATSASGCTPCYPRQMETAPGKRRSNLLFTASFQLVEKTLKDFRQVAFGVINYVLPQTNGAEFQILSYLCPLLCTGGGEFVQERGEFILVLQHKDNKLLSIYRNI